MSHSPRASIERCFSELTDPRRRKVVYPLVNVVTIAICAVLCGADDFVAIAAFGRKKQEWLSKFLDLSAGIPSHDRFNAILAAIKVDEFQKCLLEFITAIHEVTNGQVVAIDGKTLRRSFDRACSKSAIHMVSAWASANHISLGQVVVDEKSNEITAIPKLLEILELSGCLVTIDAMGCQVEIARAVVDAKADYVLAVKNNQPTLAQGVEAFFVENSQDDFAEVETRRWHSDKVSQLCSAKVSHRLAAGRGIGTEQQDASSFFQAAFWGGSGLALSGEVGWGGVRRVGERQG